ncbi:MAG: hypothetical protein ACKN82_15400, partial [Pirellula sp.]
NFSDKPKREVLVHYKHAYRRKWLDCSRWLCFEVCSSTRIFSKIHYPFGANPGRALRSALGYLMMPRWGKSLQP